MAVSIISTFSPRTALAVDAIACLAGALIVLVSGTVWSWTDLPDQARMPVGIALLLFGLLLLVAALNPRPQLFTLAVLGNLAWIAAGAVGLFVTSTWLGGVIIGLVMIADAVMAAIQFRGTQTDPLA